MTTAAKPPRRSRTAPRGDGPARAARETTSAATGQAEASTAKRAPGRPAGTGKGLACQTRTRPLLVHLGPVERERIAELAAQHGVSSAEWIRSRSLTTLPVTGLEVAALLEEWQWDDTSSEEHQALALAVRWLRAACRVTAAKVALYGASSK